MKLKYLILFVIGILLGGCNDDDSNDKNDSQSNYYTHAGIVKVLKDELISHIEVDKDQPSLLIFSKNVSRDILPKENDVVFIDRCDKFPDAFIGKVIEIIENNHSYTIQTEIPALNEVFQNLSIDTLLVPKEQDMLVLDADGNPVEYEILEDFNPEAYIGDSLIDVTPKTRGGAHWGNTKSWKFELKYDTKKGMKTDGTVILSQNTQFSIDINNFHLDYLKYSVNPSIYVGARFIAESKVGFDFKDDKAIPILVIYPFGLSGVWIETPIGIPVILHPRYGLYAVGGIKGSVTLISTIQYQYGIDLGFEKKNRNSDIIPYGQIIDYSQKTPLLTSNLEMKGEAYIGALIDLFIGIYSRKSGVGSEITGKLSAQADFSLNGINVEASNPKVRIGLLMNANAYAALNLFDGKLSASYKYQPFDDWEFWSNNYYLLPNFKNFDAAGENNKGSINYQIESGYLLSWNNAVTHGCAVFDSDDKKIESLISAPGVKPDKQGNRFYNEVVEGLQPGRTYYATPMVSWMGYEWYGNKHEFSTEASYCLGFRCVNQDYDVINFDFSLNNTTGNIIDYTTEAQDYGGSLMRIHITAQYNAVKQTLDGIFDFYFYDDPEQKRQDGFTVSLANDDSGYVDCSKVVDNGGCYAALRISKAGTKATNKKYTKVLVEDDCNIGIFNKDYKK